MLCRRVSHRQESSEFDSCLFQSKRAEIEATVNLHRTVRTVNLTPSSPCFCAPQFSDSRRTRTGLLLIPGFNLRLPLEDPHKALPLTQPRAHTPRLILLVTPRTTGNRMWRLRRDLRDLDRGSQSLRAAFSSVSRGVDVSIGVRGARMAGTYG